MPDEYEEERAEPDIADEVSSRAWLDVPHEDTSREPPPGDVPDSPPPSAAESQPGVWNRILGLIRGR